MGDGNIETPNNINLLPVSAQSADCKYRDICLRLKMAIYDIYDGHKMSQNMAIWVSNEPSLSDILIYEDENGF